MIQLLSTCKNEFKLINRAIRELSDNCHIRFIIQRHEDKFHPGIPDVSYVGYYANTGWIEFKHVKQYAKQSGDIIFSRWTATQRQWCIDRGMLGARSCCIVWCQGDLWYVPWKFFPTRQKEPGQRVNLSTSFMYPIVSWDTLAIWLTTGV